MINTVADFLQALFDKHRPLLREKSCEIRHPTMIGDMYEGLTRDLMGRAVFECLDVRVCSGKIRSKLGLSGQIDCMVVIGPGESIPFTPLFIYDLENVVGVIEVKKVLFASQLAEAYDALHRIRELGEINVDGAGRLVDMAYRCIVRKELPGREELSSQSLMNRQVYWALGVEALLPVRVVVGFEGLTKEASLRNKFVELLNKRLEAGSGAPVRGYGPSGLPNLITCNQVSLIKGNGMPYGVPLSSKGYWEVMTSRRRTPMLVLLEMIWTKLANRLKIHHSIFGDDLTTEAVSPLLRCRAAEKNGVVGWNYEFIEYTEHQLSAEVPDSPWEPAKISSGAHYAFYIFQANIDDGILWEEVESEVREFGEDTTKLRTELLETGLVYIDADKRLQALARDIVTLRTPDGACYAGDNTTGRMERWFLKQQVNSQDENTEGGTPHTAGS